MEPEWGDPDRALRIVTGGDRTRTFARVRTGGEWCEEGRLRRGEWWDFMGQATKGVGRPPAGGGGHFWRDGFRGDRGMVVCVGDGHGSFTRPLLTLTGYFCVGGSGVV